MAGVSYIEIACEGPAAESMLPDDHPNPRNRPAGRPAQIDVEYAIIVSPAGVETIIADDDRHRPILSFHRLAQKKTTTSSLNYPLQPFLPAFFKHVEGGTRIQGSITGSPSASTSETHALLGATMLGSHTLTHRCPDRAAPWCSNDNRTVVAHWHLGHSLRYWARSQTFLSP